MIALDEKREVQCPVTGSNAQFYCTKDGAFYFIEKSSNVLFQHPLPTVQDMASYADEQYSTGAYQAYVRAKDLKVKTSQWRLDAIKEFRPGKKLLDIGCSCGFFMETAAKQGFDVEGVEFSQTAKSMADDSIRDRIITGDVNALKAQTDRKYDVVTAFDIIEHTHDPGAFLSEVSDLIPTGGLLVITTPDTEHYLRYLMGSRWPMLQAVQHTVLFSRKSLIDLARRTGFSLLKACDAKKALTPKYLFEQLADLNPLLFASYKATSKVIPGSLLNMGIFVNIGEFMLVLRKD